MIVSDTFGRPVAPGPHRRRDRRERDRRGRRPARHARRARPHAAGHRGRDRRRDRVGGRARDGQGRGRAGRDRARARPRRGSARARSASSSARRRRTCSGERRDAFPRSSRRAARSARSGPSRSTAALLDALVEAACLAPAPHHSRPWRFVVSTPTRARPRSRDGMGARWRADLAADGVAPARIDELVAGVAHEAHARARARARLPHVGRSRPLPRRDAPARRVGHGVAVARRRGREPDARRGRPGLASCWVAAPIFCPEAARDALALPDEWLPHALVLVGHPDPAYVGRDRPPVPLDDAPPRHRVARRSSSC